MDEWVITVLVNGKDVEFIKLSSEDVDDNKAVIKAIETQLNCTVDGLRVAPDRETATVWIN